jgi:hypothetical protein
LETLNGQKASVERFKVSIYWCTLLRASGSRFLEVSSFKTEGDSGWLMFYGGLGCVPAELGKASV